MHYNQLCILQGISKVLTKGDLREPEILLMKYQYTVLQVWILKVTTETITRNMNYKFRYSSSIFTRSKINNIMQIFRNILSLMSSYSPRNGLYSHWPQNVNGSLDTVFTRYDSFEECFPNLNQMRKENLIKSGFKWLG